MIDPDFNGDLIYLLNPLTGGIQRLFGDSPNPGARFFGWHPDSRQVLLWTIGNSLRLADVASGQHIIYIDDTNDMNNSFLGGIHVGVVAANGQIIYSHRGIEPSLWMIRNSFDERTPPTELSPAILLFGNLVGFVSVNHNSFINWLALHLPFHQMGRRLPFMEWKNLQLKTED